MSLHHKLDEKATLPDGAPTELSGYASERSVTNGEQIDFFVTTTASSFSADISWLRHGDTNPLGPGFREAVVSHGVAQDVPGVEQETFPGAYLFADGIPLPEVGWDFTILVEPHVVESARSQGIAAGYADEETTPRWVLSLDAHGHLTLSVGETVTQCKTPVPLRRWIEIRAGVNADGQPTVSFNRVSGARSHERSVTETSPHNWSITGPTTNYRILLGAGSFHNVDHPERGAHAALNGKIENPDFSVSATAKGVDETSGVESPDFHVAGWRFYCASSLVIESSGVHATRLVAVNLPVPSNGHAWPFLSLENSEMKDTYTALALHADALEDAAWLDQVTWTIPNGLRSGVYCLRVRSGNALDRIPFVVRPTQPQAKVLVLLPTLTYLAYGNERMKETSGFDAELLTGVDSRRPHDLDLQLQRHPKWGISLYDLHAGGDGCCFVSWRRPIPNLRPDYRSWLQNGPRGLGADLYLIDWLEEMGVPYDVVTDEDLHREGAPLLAKYEVLMTGSHPEYWTSSMLSALLAYQDGGGDIMYLGGNGFYWVTAVDPQRPHIAEVRRGYAGSRSWEPTAGETRHSLTGEPGGLWRHRGMAPQRFVGVGMAAQGWDTAAGGYRRTAESFEEPYESLFRGITDEVIGDFGLVMGGAAGDELDKADYRLGTPEDAVVLATTERFSHYYWATLENVLALRPGLEGDSDPDLVRADIVFAAATGRGGFFSVGSINWFASLSHNDYNNNVSKLTYNVLTAFLGAAS